MPRAPTPPPRTATASYCPKTQDRRERLVPKYYRVPIFSVLKSPRGLLSDKDLGATGSRGRTWADKRLWRRGGARSGRHLLPAALGVAPPGVSPRSLRTHALTQGLPRGLMKGFIRNLIQSLDSRSQRGFLWVSLAVSPWVSSGDLVLVLFRDLLKMSFISLLIYFSWSSSC